MHIRTELNSLPLHVFLGSGCTIVPERNANHRIFVLDTYLLAIPTLSPSCSFRLVAKAPGEMASSSPTTALSVSKKQIMCSEILSVTSAMRKNSRWASGAQTPLYTRDDALAASMGLRRIGGGSDASGSSARQEVLLMAGFLELKREVRDAAGTYAFAIAESSCLSEHQPLYFLDVDSISLTSLLSPFFALIRSPLSTGPITSAALAAIHTFFVSGFVSPDASDLEPVLAELSSTVSNCKFEASDASGDEAVLYRIMAVIEQCMCGPTGKRLGDIEVCEMLETVLTTCCQMRLSGMLNILILGLIVDLV